MTHIKMGNKIFSKFSPEPAVAVVIDTHIPIEEVASIKEKGASLLEIRFDLMDGPFERTLSYVKDLGVEIGMPMIGTLRETEFNRGERLSLFEQLIPLVDAVDIEIDAEIAPDVISLADAHAKTIIVSEHDYYNMPDNAGLKRIMDKSITMGADIVKIAALSSSFKETARLMNFAMNSEKPIVAIAMGDYGKVSRMAGMIFGSLYTYAFISSGVAPGQLSLDELLPDLKKYYPLFKAD